MWLDAVFAYLHYLAIFILFSFLTVQAMILRGPLDHRAVRLLGRADMWYAGAAVAALATGMVRAGAGAKGGDFYFSSWPIYVKIAIFVAVGLMSIKPTLTFIRWRRACEQDPSWTVPAAEHASTRKLVMAEVHLAALIPLVAVIMARGLGR